MLKLPKPKNGAEKSALRFWIIDAVLLLVLYLLLGGALSPMSQEHELRELSATVQKREALCGGVNSSAAPVVAAVAIPSVEGLHKELLQAMQPQQQDGQEESKHQGGGLGESVRTILKDGDPKSAVEVTTRLAMRQARTIALAQNTHDALMHLQEDPVKLQHPATVASLTDSVATSVAKAVSEQWQTSERELLAIVSGSSCNDPQLLAMMTQTPKEVIKTVDRCTPAAAAPICEAKRYRDAQTSSIVGWFWTLVTVALAFWCGTKAGRSGLDAVLYQRVMGTGGSTTSSSTPVKPAISAPETVVAGREAIVSASAEVSVVKSEVDPLVSSPLKAEEDGTPPAADPGPAAAARRGEITSFFFLSNYLHVVLERRFDLAAELHQLMGQQLLDDHASALTSAAQPQAASPPAPVASVSAKAQIKALEDALEKEKDTVTVTKRALLRAEERQETLLSQNTTLEKRIEIVEADLDAAMFKLRAAAMDGTEETPGNAEDDTAVASLATPERQRMATEATSEAFLAGYADLAELAVDAMIAVVDATEQAIAAARQSEAAAHLAVSEARQQSHVLEDQLRQQQEQEQEQQQKQHQEETAKLANEVVEVVPEVNTSPLADPVPEVRFDERLLEFGLSVSGMAVEALAQSYADRFEHVAELSLAVSTITIQQQASEAALPEKALQEETARAEPEPVVIAPPLPETTTTGTVTELATLNNAEIQTDTEPDETPAGVGEANALNVSDSAAQTIPQEEPSKVDRGASPAAFVTNDAAAQYSPSTTPPRHSLADIATSSLPQTTTDMSELRDEIHVGGGSTEDQLQELLLRETQEKHRLQTELDLIELRRQQFQREKESSVDPTTPAAADDADEHQHPYVQEPSEIVAFGRGPGNNRSPPFVSRRESSSGVAVVNGVSEVIHDQTPSAVIADSQDSIASDGQALDSMQLVIDAMKPLDSALTIFNSGLDGSATTRRRPELGAVKTLDNGEVSPETKAERINASEAEGAAQPPLVRRGTWPSELAPNAPHHQRAPIVEGAARKEMRAPHRGLSNELTLTQREEVAHAVQRMMLRGSEEDDGGLGYGPGGRR